MRSYGAVFLFSHVIWIFAYSKKRDTICYFSLMAVGPVLPWLTMLIRFPPAAGHSSANTILLRSVLYYQID